MIKEALQYIVELRDPNIQKINGNMYSDKNLHRIDTYFPKAKAIEMTTLSSLVDYIKSNVDIMSQKMIIQVVSPEEVRLISQLDDNRERETLVIVKASLPIFLYEKFIDHETFRINVQSKFLDDPSTYKALILKFAGTIESGTVTEYGDDGVTQKATIKTGIASKGDAIVPNPVKLRPFRTFVEVEQPVSEFIFRVNDIGNKINCAIFEADGGAWKNEAMKNIKNYLEFELSELLERFTIIS